MALQFGHVCIISLNRFKQKGMKQQPSQSLGKKFDVSISEVQFMILILFRFLKDTSSV